MHGIKTGQTVRVTVGHKTYQHRISGIVSSPEFLMANANPEYFLPEKGSLAVIYTSLDRVFDALGFAMVNDLLFTFKQGADPEATKSAILQKLGARNLERVIHEANTSPSSTSTTIVSYSRSSGPRWSRCCRCLLSPWYSSTSIDSSVVSARK